MIITSHAEAIHWDVCRRSESNEKHLVATSDGRQALQTGGPSPKQVDVLRLPNRDLVEDPAVYVQRKAASDGQRPTLAASKSNLLIVIYTKGERSTPTDNKQVAEISQFPGHLGQVCTRQTAALTSITTNAQVCPEEHAQCLVFLSAQHSSAQNFACLRGPTETS